MPDPVVVTPPTTTTPWFEGKADAETIGYFKNRGWDTKDAVTVALEASKAHREAERMIGAPANELIRVPKDANDPAWRSVWQRLGAPADDKGYDFSGIKFSNGDALDEKFTTALRTAAAKAGAPLTQVQEIARAMVQHMEATDAAEAAEYAAKLAQEKDTLNRNWAANRATNMLTAQKAAEALGVTAEDIAALEKVVGYGRVMEMFRTIGTKIGEPQFVRNDIQGNGVMTRDQAIAKLADLKRDKGWCNKLMNGDVATKLEEDNLNRVISPPN